MVNDESMVPLDSNFDLNTNAIRIMTGAQYNAHTNPLIKK